MSLFDDIPLEVGTKYYEKTIVGWNPETQKYLVVSPYQKDGIWLSRSAVESTHANSLLSGVEFREAKPGNSYNTRYFRSRA